ncbi:MAG: DUF721 domain-containing protein [Mariprofundus sp.]|nr:DUF721 domain-containing protein [Mariprofundus sp.]
MSRRNKRSRSQLTGLHDNLAGILGEESMQKLIGIARLRRAWPQVVGAMMSARTEPLQIEALADGGICLWVAVDHSIMAQQIRFLRDDIRKACYKHAGMTDLYRIRSRVQPGAGIKAKQIPRKPAPLSLTEKRRLAHDVASIKDRTLRKAAFQARMSQVMYDDSHEGSISTD